MVASKLTNVSLGSSRHSIYSLLSGNHRSNHKLLIINQFTGENPSNMSNVSNDNTAIRTQYQPESLTMESELKQFASREKILFLRKNLWI